MLRSEHAEIVSRGDADVSRACRACGASRPIVLFPKMSHGRHSFLCQLCTDAGRRKRRAAREDSEKNKAAAAARARQRAAS
jgi:hypothetical protein